MKTTIGKACDAYKEFDRLLMKEIPLSIGVKLHRMRTALRETYEFGCAEERKARAAYGVVEGKNGLLFRTLEIQRDYKNRIAEIRGTETEIDIQPLAAADFGDIPVALGYIDDFVNLGG